MKLKALALVVPLLATFGIAHGAYVIGDTVADFTANDASGSAVSLYEYRGMVVMINFWTNT